MLMTRAGGPTDKKVIACPDSNRWDKHGLKTVPSPGIARQIRVMRNIANYRTFLLGHIQCAGSKTPIFNLYFKGTLT